MFFNLISNTVGEIDSENRIFLRNIRLIKLLIINKWLNLTNQIKKSKDSKKNIELIVGKFSSNHTELNLIHVNLL